MIYKRYVRTPHAIDQVRRHLITNFGNAEARIMDDCLFFCPPIGRAFQMLDPLEYRDPVSQEKKVLPADDVFRIVFIDDIEPRTHLHLEKLENGKWIGYGQCYGLDKKKAGILNWHAVRPPLKDSDWAREQRMLEHQQCLQKSQLSFLPKNL